MLSNSQSRSPRAGSSLGEEHLTEAEKAIRSDSKRSAFSRAYYASYSASKAVRYMVEGAVSLGADDHRKASELPTDFPDAARWAKTITGLYEDRLRADYDNWLDTESQFSRPTSDAVILAKEFITAARSYLMVKYGVQL